MLWIPYLVDFLHVCLDDFGPNNYSVALAEISAHLGGDLRGIWPVLWRTVCYSIPYCRRVGYGHSLLGKRYPIRPYSLREQLHFMSVIVETPYNAHIQIVLRGDNND